MRRVGRLGPAMARPFGFARGARAVVTTTDDGVQADRGEVRGAAPRQARMVVRRVDPWSVLKLSVLFYFCVMLIFLLAMVILYWVLGFLGVLESTSDLLTTLGFGDPNRGFRFDGFYIFSRLFVGSAIGVVVWSLVNMFLAVLYNMVADIVGGISITLAERR